MVANMASTHVSSLQSYRYLFFLFVFLKKDFNENLKCPLYWNGVIFWILSTLKTSEYVSHEHNYLTMLCFKMEDMLTLVLHFVVLKLKRNLF